MTAPPLVSVFLPTYNQVRFVDEAIATAVDQDYEHLEVVVIDDGSTDGTQEIIARWASKYPARIVPLIGMPHVGITPNCNRGLRACRGKYIAFGAGDDMFLPGKISAQVKWMEEDDRRVVCGHDVEVFESTTNRRIFLWSERFPLRSGYGAAGAIDGIPFCGPSIMIRARALPRGGYDERLPRSSDAKLWVDCLAGGGSYGYVRGVYSRYRRHHANVSNVDDLERGEALYADMLAFYTLIAAEYPDLKVAAEKRRARVCWGVAGWYLRRGDQGKAVPYLVDALTFWSRSPLFARACVKMLPNGAVLRMAMGTRRLLRNAAIWVRARWHYTVGWTRTFRT